ncbi:MAG: ABC transporter permease [Planctomycetota bacterium]|nr:ABC transporter permease [Planctomycetota bacterium]
MTRAAPVGPAPQRPRGRIRVSRWFAGLLVCVAAFVPLLANDVPLVARVGGHWSFPAFADCVGPPPPGPADLSWKQWWSRLPAGEDFAIMPPWAHGPGETDPALYRSGPSLMHPLGNDDSGRDLLARLLYGTRTAVGIGLVAVGLAALIGTLLGALAGYRRGLVDVLVLRLIEVFLCFPSLLFLLFASAFFGSSWLGLVLVMASLFWTSFARIVRGELLALRERDFVLVARGLGVSERRILWRHLMPLVKSQIGVTAAFCMASAIVAESTLSFLGLGLGSAASSWGDTLRKGSQFAHLGAWHLWLFPALVIVAVVRCCHVLADQLRGRDVAAG